MPESLGPLSAAMISFDEDYYSSVIREYGYDPVDVQPINFAFPNLPREELAARWFCHHDGMSFVVGLKKREPSIVTTGFGLSGLPHVGTISQMFGAIRLQKADIFVQIVLGDLDAYNARGASLNQVSERAEQYEKFILALGFDPARGYLRRQIDYANALLEANLIARVLRDADFAETEEDLSRLYIAKGIYPGIEFPVKQAILLMISDFVELKDRFANVMVMLGIDEHRYVRLAREAAKRMNYVLNIGGLYSRLNRGFNGFPKMSKSIPGSAISVGDSADTIRDMILNQEGGIGRPEQSPVFQMMCSLSNYGAEELRRIQESCRVGDAGWRRNKEAYADFLISIFEKWES